MSTARIATMATTIPMTMCMAPIAIMGMIMITAQITAQITAMSTARTAITVTTTNNRNYPDASSAAWRDW